MTYRVPDPPILSDKLADFEILAAAGGDVLFDGKHVLDVGPLYGFEAMLYVDRAADYWALDCSDEVLDRQPPAVRRRRWDITQAPWPFKDECFDTVLDLSTFDDTRAPMVCYREAVRVLRPGGILLTAFANARVIPPTTEWTNQDPEELAKELEAIGLRVVFRFRGRWDQARAYLAADKRTQ